MTGRGEETGKGQTGRRVAPEAPEQSGPAVGGEEGGGSSSGGGEGQQQGEGEQGKGEQKEEPSRAEWVVGIVCSLVVLAAVGYLFYEAFTGPSLPPMVTVRVERVVPMPTGYLVEFRAENYGSETAVALGVEGALMQDALVVERSSATLDFVPAETERRGGLFFTRDPRLYRLEVRPTGFDRP